MYPLFLLHNPSHAEAHYELAWLLRNTDEPVLALSHYQRALDLKILKPEEIHLNRAVIYAEELQDYLQADIELIQALALRPAYFEAMLNRGNLQEDVARKNTALKIYGQILSAANEDQMVFRVALARTLQLMGAEASEAQMAQAHKLADRTSIVDAATNAGLWFAMAHVRQAQKLFTAAFALFERANQINASTAPSYNADFQEALFDAVIADLHQLRSQSNQSAQHAIDQTARFQPIFIIGMFRSGSTLIEQVLNAHPQVQAFGEISFLPRLVSGALQPFPKTLSAISAQTMHTWRQRYLARFGRTTIAEGVRFCTDKRPDNFLYLGLIKRLFPSAKIIHTVRNPIDNALSIFQQQLDPRVAAYTSDWASIAHNYALYLRCMSAAKSVFSDDVFELDYEQFVQNPELVLRELLQFLGLVWDERCLRFHSQTNAVKTASLWQIRQPIHTGSQGRWRVYQEQLQPLIAALRSYGVPLPSLD